MSLKLCFPGFCLLVLSVLTRCGCEQNPASQADFTKADSLTETYLALQDTMLQVWNTMIHDDNRKIKAMEHLLHELSVSSPEKHEQLADLGERLNDLAFIRYDQNSMSDSERVSAYDFASNSLVTEVIALAESRKEFAYNSTLQKLVDSIRAADQRVLSYREEYDIIAARFNSFVLRNREILTDSTLKTKPLFQMATE